MIKIDRDHPNIVCNYILMIIYIYIIRINVNVHQVRDVTRYTIQEFCMYQDVLCTMLFHSFHLFSLIYDIYAIQNLMPVVTRSGPDDPGASAAQHEKTQRRRNSLGSIRHVRIANGRANCLGARSRHHGGKRQKDIEITRTTVQSSRIAVLLGEKPFKNQVLHSEIPLRLLASLPVSGSTVCQVSSKQL